MKKINLEKIVKEMVCLECGSGMGFCRTGKEKGRINCKKCSVVYPLRDGIITALPQRERKWEDDDVAFWDNKYLGDCLQLRSKKLVERAYLRDKILFEPLRRSKIAGKYILEIGCGEAISAQKSLFQFNSDFIYFATDYSYGGLKILKKRLKNKNNVIYIQCLGDAIPFKDGFFDAIISLGVIHHMPKKEAHVPYLVSKLKPGGLMLVDEGYNRAYRLPRIAEKIVQVIIEPRQSAHEERINIGKFRKNFQKAGRIVNEYHCHTPVKTVLIKITGSLYERSVMFVKFLLAVDKLTEKTIGRLWRLFSTGDCLLLFEKSNRVFSRKR